MNPLDKGASFTRRALHPSATSTATRPAGATCPPAARLHPTLRNSLTTRSTFVPGLLLVLMACGSSEPRPRVGTGSIDPAARSTTPEHRAETASSVLPSRLLAYGTGNGPALFNSSGSDGVPVGFIEGPIEVEVAEGIINQRVRVNIEESPFRTVGLYLDAAHLGAYVQGPTLLRGTPVELHQGDLVRVRGPGIDANELLVAAEPYMSLLTAPLGRWEGAMPRGLLGTERSRRPDDGRERGAQVVFPNEEAILVYDEPGGVELARFTLRYSLITTVRQTRGAWHQLCFGRGACVLGWTDAARDPTPRRTGTVGALMGGAIGGNFGMGGLGLAVGTSSGPPRELVEACESGDIWRLARGTEMFLRSRVIAVLIDDAWGCESRRGTATALVSVVGDDAEVAIFGWVALAALQPAAVPSGDGGDGGED